MLRKARKGLGDASSESPCVTVGGNKPARASVYSTGPIHAFSVLPAISLRKATHELSDAADGPAEHELDTQENGILDSGAL